MSDLSSTLEKDYSGAVRVHSDRKASQKILLEKLIQQEVSYITARLKGHSLQGCHDIIFFGRGRDMYDTSYYGGFENDCDRFKRWWNRVIKRQPYVVNIWEIYSREKFFDAYSYRELGKEICSILRTIPDFKELKVKFVKYESHYWYRIRFSWN